MLFTVRSGTLSIHVCSNLLHAFLLQVFYETLFRLLIQAFSKSGCLLFFSGGCTEALSGYSERKRAVFSSWGGLTCKLMPNRTRLMAKFFDV